MKRVEIQNQFDPSNPWISFMAARGPCHVNRVQVGTVHQPSNWTEFCDEVDATLETLSKTKRLYYIASFLTLALVAVIIAGLFLFRSIIRSYIYEFKNPAAFMIFPVIVLIFASLFTGLYCKMYSSLTKTFSEVSSICLRYSVPNVVSYQLKDEWWGGCR